MLHNKTPEKNQCGMIKVRMVCSRVGMSCCYRTIEGTAASSASMSKSNGLQNATNSYRENGFENLEGIPQARNDDFQAIGVTIGHALRIKTSDGVIHIQKLFGGRPG